jgi:hypothetical protein
MKERCFRLLDRFLILKNDFRRENDLSGQG